MIISHQYRYIFLKTNKTAGTSVEIALSRFCGQDDIITRLPDTDEKVRSSLGYPGARNYFAPLSEYGLNDYKRLLYGKRKPRFKSHTTATEAKAWLPADVWNSYYKFSIERNPWDRVVSFFYWTTKNDPNADLDSYLRSGGIHKLKRRGIELYSVDGQVVADQVCLFENLEDDLEQVRQHLGMPEPLSLPRTKTQSRKDKRHYRDILTDAQSAVIAELFSDEIERYGYSY